MYENQELTHTVIIGAAGTGASFAIATRLRATWGADVRIVGMDINPSILVTASLLCDDFHCVPRVDDPEFPEVLDEILHAEAPATYIPILNDEIVIASSLVDIWGARGVDVVAPEPAIANLCQDKLELSRWLEKIGVHCPSTSLPRDRAGQGPWFMKPRNGFGSRDASIADAAILNAADPKDLEIMVLQEVCAQPEVTVDSFFDAETGTGRAVCRERLETKTGVCTKARVFEDEELTAVAVRIGREIGQRGTICFQVMRLAERWALTDLNMRPGAGTALTCAAGFDVLSAFLACRWGLPTDLYFPAEAQERDMILTRQYSEFVMRA